MRFYTQQRRFYAGVDLHARTLSLCIVNQAGEVVLANKLPCDGAAFLKAIAPFRKNLVVGCECMFCWYWLADLCAEQRLEFVIGHALYLKAIHGGKSKTDAIDADKIARLLRGGNFPLAYAYPKGMRETRDLLRRRTYLVRKRAEVIAHLRNLASQYNRPPFAGNVIQNRDVAAVLECFEDPSVRHSAKLDMTLLERYDELVVDVERYLIRTTEVQNAEAYARLRSVPGIGRILGMVLLYEIHDVQRFASVGDFLSYARLVRCLHESAGKVQGSGNNKIGNAHLRWGFAEAALQFVCHHAPAKRWLDRQAQRRGSKGRALGILAARLGRAVYHMLRKGDDFDEQRFWGNAKPNRSESAPSKKAKRKKPRPLATTA